MAELATDVRELRPRSAESAWLSLTSLLFLALGLALPLIDTDVDSCAGVFCLYNQPWSQRVGSYLCMGLGAVGLLLGLSRLLVPGCTRLRLSREGFSYAGFFRETVICWRDVDRFFVHRIAPMGLTVGERVAFNLHSQSGRSTRRLRLNRSIAGCDDMLPDNFGLSADALAELLDQRLQAFRRQQGA